MANPASISISQQQDISNILHLAIHRNKNQHRASKWWKWLMMLRRSVDKHVAESARDKIAFEARTAHLRDYIVPRCYIAFNDLIADNQFAPLGLMLMGVLARVYRLTGGNSTSSDGGLSSGGGTTPLVANGHVVSETSIVAGEALPAASSDAKPALLPTMAADLPVSFRAGEDVGVVVDREVLVGAREEGGAQEARDEAQAAERKPGKGMGAGNGAEEGSLRSRTEVRGKRKGGDGVGKTGDSFKRSSKKRKKGNAIDDLFSGLL